MPTRDDIAIGVILPVVQLAYGERIALVPIVITNIHGRVRKIVNAFLASPKQNPRIELVYTYLVVSYVLHYLALMTPLLLGGIETYLRRLAGCSWAESSLLLIREILLDSNHYRLY